MVNGNVFQSVVEEFDLKRLTTRDKNGALPEMSTEVTALVYTVGEAVRRTRFTPPVYTPPLISADTSQQTARLFVANCVPAVLENIYNGVTSARAKVPSNSAASVMCESSLLYGINLLLTSVSSNGQLSSTTVSHLLHTVMKDCRSDVVLRRCMTLLHKLLSLHPPCNKSQRRIYCDALNNGNSNQGWTFVLESIETVLKMTADTTSSSSGGRSRDNKQQYVRVQFVEWLVSLMEKDICAWFYETIDTGCYEAVHNQLQLPLRRPLLVRLLSCGDQQLAAVRRCQPLLQLLVEAYLPPGRAVSCDHSVQTSVCMALHRLVCVCAECVRLACQTEAATCTIDVFHDDMLNLAESLAQCIIQRFDEFTNETVDSFLCRLRPHWLLVHVSAALLRWRFGRNLHCSEFSLSVCSSVYLSSDPCFHTVLRSLRSVRSNGSLCDRDESEQNERLYRLRWLYSALVFHVISAHCSWLKLNDIHCHLSSLAASSRGGEVSLDVSPLEGADAILPDRLLISYNRELRHMASDLSSAIKVAHERGWLHRRFASYLLLMLKT